LEIAKENKLLYRNRIIVIANEYLEKLTAEVLEVYKSKDL